MAEADDQPRRVRFYGTHDLSVGWYAPRAAQIAETFNSSDPATDINDVLELYNVQQYLERGLISKDLDTEGRSNLTARIPLIRSTVARYFSEIDDKNIEARVAGVGREFHIDLLDLLARHQVFKRCRADTVLPALTTAGVHLGDQLTNKPFVNAYDTELRDAILASPKNAEHLIQKYLQDDTKTHIHLPKSLNPDDIKEIFANYIQSDDPNLNYIRLLATARFNSTIGIDARLKLEAKRRSATLEEQLFSPEIGLKVGWEVAIVDDQIEPDKLEIDDSDRLTYRYTYSRSWLEDTLDYPSILNNFLHLFEFADHAAILRFPYYPAHAGVLERIIGVRGKNEYLATPSAQVVDNATQVQTILYRSFLEENEIDLEQVIAWFCGSYVTEQYGAEGFTFSPSNRSSSYLQRVRHLFAEMEGLASQFSMFASEGKVDRELLAIAEPAQYKRIPSLLQGNYIYATERDEITRILHLLFSDQSELTYIDERTNAESAVALLARHNPKYSDFHNYQRPAVDYLINLGIIQILDGNIEFSDMQALLILKALFTTQAASYYHLSAHGRAVADSMVEKGWAVRRTTLLTDAESDYFNFVLNAVDFTNGPQLRNKYLHGVQSSEAGEDTHFAAYITALKLVIALVIKINDEFCIAESERAEIQDWTGIDFVCVM